MEIFVDSTDESLIKEDLILSVRFGGVRRQVPMNKASVTPLSFPTLLGRKDPRNIKFDVMSKVGSGWLMLRPGEERYRVPFLGCGGSKSMNVRIVQGKAKDADGFERSSVRPGTAPAGETWDGGTPSTRPCTADGGSPMLTGIGLGACDAEEAADEPSAGAGAGRSPKHRDRAQSAKDYLERHQVITFIHALLHAVLKERPADPYAFMAEQMPKADAAAMAKELAAAEADAAAMAKELAAAEVASPEAPAAPIPEQPAPVLPEEQEAAAVEPKPLLRVEGCAWAAQEEEKADLEQAHRALKGPRPTLTLASPRHQPWTEAEVEELRLNSAVLKLEVQELRRENDVLMEQLDRPGGHKGAPAEAAGGAEEAAAASRSLSPSCVRRRALNKSKSSSSMARTPGSPTIKRRPTLIRDITDKVAVAMADEVVEEDEEVPPPPTAAEGLAVRARTELVQRLSARRSTGRAPPAYIKESLAQFWKRLEGEADAADEYRVLRQSVFTGRWTLYSAGGKAKKPHQYCYGRRTPHLLEVPRLEGRCPFCVGNEHNTPPPLLYFDKDGNMREGPELCSGWRCRVIPNIFPLLVTPVGLYGDVFHDKLTQIPHSAVARGEHSNEVLFAKPQDPHDKDCLEATTHRQVNAVGYSEVIIENPAHNGLLAIVDSKQVALALAALQSRGRVLSSQPKVRQLLYFKQYGANSGGSLVHPHMQIVTLPLLTPETQNRLNRAVDFYHRFGKCSVCHCLVEEPLRQDGHACSRLVYQTANFLVVVPFASNQYRATITPRDHHHSWLSLSPERVEELGEVLQLVMEALFHSLNDPEYNVYFHSIDKAEEVLEEEAVHWVLEVHPRFPAELGGVELASGIRVISGLPEDWAQQFRAAIEERLQARRRRTTKSAGAPWSPERAPSEPAPLNATGAEGTFQRTVSS